MFKNLPKELLSEEERITYQQKVKAIKQKLPVEEWQRLSDVDKFNHAAKVKMELLLVENEKRSHLLRRAEKVRVDKMASGRSMEEDN
jgi:hypothetical protein